MSTPFAELPGVRFVDSSPEQIRQAVITGFEEIAGRTLYPGNPERLFLEGLSYVLSVFAGQVEYAGKQGLLAYASGSHLDHIGLESDTPRLGQTRAATRIEFSLASPLQWKVDILAGTRVATADGRILFATDKHAVIEAGRLSIEVPATAVADGAEANGLVPGQINSLVDPVAYIKEARNTATSETGADQEDDDSYRQRIHMAREAYSCAGPRGAYEYHVRRVHQDIVDPGIFIPKPGTVCICPLMRDGRLPPEDILEAIRKAVNADDVRPLTDTVIVRAPEVVPVHVDLDWYLPRSLGAWSGSIGAAVSLAVQAYLDWQGGRPGRDVTPDELVARVMMAGAKRLELRAPEFHKIEPYQVARVASVTVNYRGEEDE